MNQVTAAARIRAAVIDELSTRFELVISSSTAVERMLWLRS